MPMTIVVVTINWDTGQLIAGGEERQSKTQWSVREQIFIARCPPASPGTTFATASTSSSPSSSSSAAATSPVQFCVESWGT